MSTTTTRTEIAEFAAAVRAHLDDLPADDVDELTDGLVADLSDQAAEAGEAFEVPDAAAYASELRAAAGLPPRSGRQTSSPSLRRRLGAVEARVAQWRADRVAEMRATHFGGWTIDTVLALRPVWWVARAFALALVLVPLLGIQVAQRGDLLDNLQMMRHPAAWVLFGILLLLSVQWGRGRWARTGWLRVVRAVVTIATAFVTTLVLAGTILTFSSMMNASAMSMYAADPRTPGLAVDGQRVRNIFAYDANGNPIEHVQLFDQDGQPLTTVGQVPEGVEWDYYFYGGGGPLPVPEREIGRHPVWNIFPLRELSANEAMTMYGDPLSVAVDDATAPEFPFAQVPSLAPTDDAGTPAETTGTTTPEPTEVPAP